MRILVTGARGSIGSALCLELKRLGHDVYATDVFDVDVCDPVLVERACQSVRPEVIYHLAGAKHAPEGEDDPGKTARVNLLGTENVIRAADGAMVILASTCKAADPETAYGASKLIAEKIVLNAGGVVLRFYNVRETDGNVFRIWEQLPTDAPIPVTDCWRYFISLDEAIDLALAALEFPSGRYAVATPTRTWIPTLARQLYPIRRLEWIPRRRGDRSREPLQAACERTEAFGRFCKITSPHDPASVPEPLAVAA